MTRHNQWKFLDKLRRRSYIKYELKKVLLRSASKSKNLTFIQRYSSNFQLLNLPRNSSKNKVQNRCIVSGRNWNIMRRTQCSRFVFRHKSYFSYLPAVRRASW